MKTSLVELFNTPFQLRAGNEVFFISYKNVLRPERLNDARFQMLVFFLQEINNCLFTNLVACVICFEFWFRAVASAA